MCQATIAPNPKAKLRVLTLQLFCEPTTDSQLRSTCPNLTIIIDFSHRRSCRGVQLPNIPCDDRSHAVRYACQGVA